MSRSASRHTTRFSRRRPDHAGGRASDRAGPPPCRSRARTSANHSKSSGGSTASTTTAGGRPRPASHAAAKSKPPRCGSARITPLPASSALGDVLEADRGDARLHRAARVGRQAEQLQPVAAVRRERVRHRALEREAFERAAGGALEVAAHDPAAAHEERREQPAGGLGDRQPRRPTARRWRRRRPCGTRRTTARPSARRQGRLRRAARTARRSAARSALRHRLACRDDRRRCAGRWCRARRKLGPRRQVGRLAPHLHEPLHRGHGHQHDHDPEHRHEDVEVRARCRAAPSARRVP